MQFTKELLENLKDSGKEISLYSNKISKIIRTYHHNNFNKFSRRSYYHWTKMKRPIPLSITLQVMNDKNIDKIPIEYFCVSGGNKIKFPNDKDLRYGYLLGLILGDGCLIHRKRSGNRNTYLINISFVNKEGANKIKIIIKKLFGIESSIYWGNGCYVLTTHSKPIVLILNKQYQIPIGKKYGSIKVPDLIFNGNKIMKKAFIRGVFDSDGNIYMHRNNKCVQLRQKSKYFVNEIKTLLDGLNIKFRDPYYDKANNSWLLWSSKKSLVDNFINEIVEFNIGAPVA